MALDLYLSIDKKITFPFNDSSSQLGINSFSLGVSTASTTGVSAGASKPSVSNLNLSINDTSLASTALLQSALNGTSHTYYLYAVKSGSGTMAATPIETYTFTNGFVSGFSEAGSNGGDLTDSVSIAFKSMTRSVTPATASGAPSANPMTVTYDAVANKVSAAHVAAPADPSAGDDASAPTDETFTFKTGSAQNIANVLGSQRGQAAVAEIAGDFSSLAAVFAATHPSSDGTGTVITLPNQNAITLAGLPEKQIRADAGQFKHLLFG